MPFKDPEEYRQYQNAYHRNRERQRGDKYRAQAKARRSQPEVAARLKIYFKEYRLKNREAIRHKRMLAKFGIGSEDYAFMLGEQGGVCAICKRANDDGKPLAVDHCHSTGKVRGLLCSNCNVGIGHLRDSPTIMKSASEYIMAESTPFPWEIFV